MEDRLNGNLSLIHYSPTSNLNLNDTSLTDEGVTTVCRALAGSAPHEEDIAWN